VRTVDIRQIKICQAKGIPITSDSIILDFGCGDGHRVYQLHDAGYKNAYGFNKGDYLKMENPVTLRQDTHREWFRFSTDGRIPFPDATFDLIISDQVFEHVLAQEKAFREIHRVLKPYGVSIHVIPAKWRLIEPHIHVPLGGFMPFKHYAWFYLWALLGVRNPYQRGRTAAAVARENVTYARECLNYLSCRQYRKLFSNIPFRYSWEELAYMQSSYKPHIQRAAAVAERVPLLVSLIRTFVERVLFLQRVN
jgi:SAM-dependent methyltransferase